MKHFLLDVVRTGRKVLKGHGTDFTGIVLDHVKVGENTDLIAFIILKDIAFRVCHSKFEFLLLSFSQVSFIRDTLSDSQFAGFLILIRKINCRSSVSLYMSRYAGRLIIVCTISVDLYGCGSCIS